jgi:alpha-1,2-mannosyltransferase
MIPLRYAALARWLRGKLWIGWPVGAVTWIVWLGSIAYGSWSANRPIDAEGTPVCVDHLTFYSAARLIREGRPALMYDYDFLGRYQGELLGWEWGMLLGYRNPPFYALLYLPTCGLPFLASMLIWNAIGLGMLILAIGWLKPERPVEALPWSPTREQGNDSPLAGASGSPTRARIFLWSLTFFPVFGVISFGQNSLLSLGIFAGVYRLLAGDRRLLAGLAAGLLWFKPQLLIGLFIWWGLAPRKYARCWIGVAVTGAILAAISWIALPEASWAFVASLQANLQYGGERGWNKESPRAFWSLLLPGAGPGLIWALTLVLVVPMIGAAAWLCRRTGAAVAVMFPVAVFLSLWVSPHVLVYEWSLLIAAALVLWERFPERRDAWLCLFTLTWAVLAASTPLAKVQIDYLKTPGTAQLAVPIMGIVGWLAIRELARPSLDKPRSGAVTAPTLELP